MAASELSSWALSCCLGSLANTPGQPHRGGGRGKMRFTEALGEPCSSAGLYRAGQALSSGAPRLNMAPLMVWGWRTVRRFCYISHAIFTLPWTEGITIGGQLRYIDKNPQMLSFYFFDLGVYFQQCNCEVEKQKWEKDNFIGNLFEWSNQ